LVGSIGCEYTLYLVAEVALFLTGHFDWLLFWEEGGGDDREQDLTGQRDCAEEGDWSVEVGGTVGGGVDCWLPI
jgi:hypothetical protein